MKAITIQTLIDDYSCQGFNSCTIMTDAGHEYSFIINNPNNIGVDTIDMLVMGTPMGCDNHQIVIDCAKIESIRVYKDEEEENE